MSVRAGYFAANAGSIPPELRGNSADLMANSGHNLGNLVFWHAVRRMFDNDVVMVDWNARAEDVDGAFDHLVIPAANYLNPDWDFGSQADLIDELGHECVVFGLGTQSEKEDHMPVLKPGSIRFLKALSAHARTIFVRGEYTAELCVHYGVKNVQPLGCPSITISDDLTLGQTLRQRAGEDVSSLYFSGGVLKGNTREVERQLYRTVCDLPGSSFVIQHPTQLVELAENFRIRPSRVLEVLGYREFFDPDASFTQFWRDFARVARCYGDVPTWIRDAALHSHSVNTRMHGAIMSLTAGVPTILLAHDSRIRELCRMMCLPYILPEDIGDGLDDLGQLFDNMDFDPARFDARRKEIAETYRLYLAGAGLTVSESLSRLATGISAAEISAAQIA